MSFQADTEADDDRDDEADEYGEQESAHGGSEISHVEFSEGVC
ncbi:MAG TPA: hypothetical protein VM819_13815 [Vicinamibacterales bacterium]|nr:hypothetical protein [Vicinamibacterales bacterium]